MPALHYDYSPNIEECRQRGLIWAADHAALVDPRFHELGMTQQQVTGVVSAHIHLVDHLFNPKSYRWPQRIALALHFLFRRGR